MLSSNCHGRHIAFFITFVAAQDKQGGVLDSKPSPVPGERAWPGHSQGIQNGHNHRWPEYSKRKSSLIRQEKLSLWGKKWVNEDVLSHDLNVGGNGKSPVEYYLGSDIPFDKCKTNFMTCLVDMDYLNETKGHIEINGQEFKKGIVSHAPGWAVFTLRGDYSLFRACVGISKYVSAPDCGVTSGSAKFRVLGDDIVRSQWIAKGSPQDATCTTVDISGVKRLMLETDINWGLQHCPFATWANARVVKADSPARSSACQGSSICVQALFLSILCSLKVVSDQLDQVE